LIAQFKASAGPSPECIY